MKTKIITTVAALALASTTVSAMAHDVQDNCANLESNYLRDHMLPPAHVDTGTADASAGNARSLTRCKLQWRLADLNGDGVLDAGEVAHYNSALRSSAQAPLSDNDRPSEMVFIAECTATTAHE